MPRWFLHLAIAALLADLLAAFAERTWHIALHAGLGPYLLLWVVLTALLFWPLRLIYP